MEIREVEIKRILNPTSIDLGEYVINPFRGCEFACLYCYVRHNKVTLRDMRCWGEYVDIRLNAPCLLEKELVAKKPKRVLLGSTTECFQPIEKKWQVSRKVIEVLNKHKVYYSILTRSPLLLDILPLLKEGFCETIYFTINQFNNDMKALLEPKSPSFERRIEAIEILLDEGLPVIPYFSPVLPLISEFNGVFSHFGKARRIEFESLNFSLGNIHEIIECISRVYPQWQPVYRTMMADQKTYEQMFSLTRKQIIRHAIKVRKDHRIFIHDWHAYFQNSYRDTGVTK